MWMLSFWRGWIRDGCLEQRWSVWGMVGLNNGAVGMLPILTSGNYKTDCRYHLDRLDKWDICKHTRSDATMLSCSNCLSSEALKIFSHTSQLQLQVSASDKTGSRRCVHVRTPQHSCTSARTFCPSACELWLGKRPRQTSAMAGTVADPCIWPRGQIGKPEQAAHIPRQAQKYPPLALEVLFRALNR